MGGKSQSLLKMYDQWRGWADPKVCCDYSFHVAVTWWSEQVYEEMATIVADKGDHMHKKMAYQECFEDAKLIGERERANPSRYNDSNFSIIGGRERANLVVRTAQSFRQCTVYGDLLKNGKCIRVKIPPRNQWRSGFR